jgi:predicted HicB family RNase H-like nuclease
VLVTRSGNCLKEDWNSRKQYLWRVVLRADKPLSGKFMMRISVDLHRQLYQRAAKEGKSLNMWIVDRLEQLIRKSA